MEAAVRANLGALVMPEGRRSRKRPFLEDSNIRDECLTVTDVACAEFVAWLTAACKADAQTVAYLHGRSCGDLLRRGMRHDNPRVVATCMEVVTLRLQLSPEAGDGDTDATIELVDDALAGLTMGKPWAVRLAAIALWGKGATSGLPEVTSRTTPQILSYMITCLSDRNTKIRQLSEDVVLGLCSSPGAAFRAELLGMLTLESVNDVPSALLPTLRLAGRLAACHPSAHLDDPVKKLVARTSALALDSLDEHAASPQWEDLAGTVVELVAQLSGSNLIHLLARGASHIGGQQSAKELQEEDVTLLALGMVHSKVKALMTSGVDVGRRSMALRLAGAVAPAPSAPATIRRRAAALMLPLAASVIAHGGTHRGTSDGELIQALCAAQHLCTALEDVPIDDDDVRAAWGKLALHSSPLAGSTCSIRLAMVATRFRELCARDTDAMAQPKCGQRQDELRCAGDAAVVPTGAHEPEVSPLMRFFGPEAPRMWTEGHDCS